MRFLLLFGLAGSILILTFVATPQAADPLAPAAAPRGGGAQIPANGGRITLEVNKGTLVRLAGPAATVFVANPEIADVQVKSPTLVYISAKSPGETVIYAVDASDSVLLNAPILVQHDISRLRSSLQQLAPGERISANSVDNNLVLSGVVSDAGQAEKVRALAASVANEVKGAQVINRMTVATPNQVNLQVRISEVDVSKLNNIGVNWSKAGNPSFHTFNFVSEAGAIANNLIVGKGPGAIALIEALTQEGFITDLAEPNLTAMSGQTASFLAGGEFPVPITGSAATTGGVPTITVEFKSFGVSLAFTPTVIDATHLNLRVRPEVSELNNSVSGGAVSVPITSDQVVTIPALTVRRAETSVELASGESFALAGLLHHTSSQLVSKVPWIGDVPVLGALFRSDRFQRNETDLVVIVTPYLVQPVQTRLAAPTDGLKLPNDAQRVFLSQKYRTGVPGPARGPLDAGGKGLIGPGGFRLD
jgi:pilus assembly protein CpaC